MSEQTFKRLLTGFIMLWCFACGFGPMMIVGCAAKQPEIVKPSAGRIVVPPQCFLPMYCKTAECIGAKAQYHCYSVIPDEPKGETK